MRISEAIASIMELALSEPFNSPVDLTQYPDYMLYVEYMMDFNLIKVISFGPKKCSFSPLFLSNS